MNSEDYANELRRINANPGSHYVRDFESVLFRWGELQDPGCIPMLCEFFDDGAEYHEHMFTIIHFMESFPSEIRTSQLLHTTPALSNRAPEWAATLYIRVLNSDLGRAELIHQARTATLEIRDSLRSLMEQIVAEAPQLQLKAAEVTAALQSS